MESRCPGKGTLETLTKYPLRHPLLACPQGPSLYKISLYLQIQIIGSIAPPPTLWPIFWPEFWEVLTRGLDDSWTYLAPFSSTYCILYHTGSVPFSPPMPAKLDPSPPSLRLKVSCHSSKRWIFHNNPAVIPHPILKGHPDQSNHRDFPFSSFLPCHSSAPEQCVPKFTLSSVHFSHKAVCSTQPTSGPENLNQALHISKWAKDHVKQKVFEEHKHWQKLQNTFSWTESNDPVWLSALWFLLPVRVMARLPVPSVDINWAAPLRGWE